jgi:NADPH-dependent 2,4-dienoyl-CoA reductase/sulfur reductase-like enzyme
MKPDKVCIIGAGAAGIATANALSRTGVAFDWFELGSKLGGIWRYGNDSGSSVYASLITNTSQVNMEWFGCRMPKATNDYLTHEEVLDYLASFAARANLENKITFSARVTSVKPREEGSFCVRIESRSGESFVREYGAVIVAIGCHSTPKWPKIPGISNVAVLHASDYRTPEIFAGKRVVVAGFGASGADIACDAANVAKSVALSTRSGGYLVPRYVGNKPRDEGGRAWVSLAPRVVRQHLWRLMLMRRQVSPKVRAALERQTAPFRKPAVINDRLTELIDTDGVVVIPGIERVEADRAILSDGTRVECDLLVCATGYEVAYPFFSPDVAEQNGSFEDRYLRVVPPNQPGLYFVGRISVVGPFFPVLERQALWVADLLSGRCILPSAVELHRRAARETRAACTSFPDAERKSDLVEFYPYVRALNREHAAGRARRLKQTGVVDGGRAALHPEPGEHASS